MEQEIFGTVVQQLNLLQLCSGQVFLRSLELHKVGHLELDPNIDGEPPYPYIY